ncbi:MAG: O-antigen biosynthesis protein WbqP, partial [Sphingobacteriales bacterium]
MYKFVKRFIDIMASLGVLILFSPIMLVLAILIFVQDFGNPIFSHFRVGKNGKEFKFFKFRSMPLNTPNVTSSETGKLKVTPLGKFIRRSNLDELPQLVNILIGDMSLIGPRPPIPSQVGLLKLRKDNGALGLKPGLTGWAQVNSFDGMQEDKKAEFDGEY